jgi:hypothetical protein
VRKDGFPVWISIDSLLILTTEMVAGTKFMLYLEKILAMGIFLSLNRNPHTVEANALTFKLESAFRGVQGLRGVKLGTQCITLRKSLQPALMN